MLRCYRIVCCWGFLTAGLLCGCVPDDREFVAGAADPAEAGYQVPPAESLIVEGKQTYETHCAGCHGDKGDGLGAAARFLHPKPRNFITAKYKFSSRRSGNLPTDEDLFHTITYGLRGSSMPGWKLLPERQRWAVVSYIKTFSDAWEQVEPGSPIPIVEDPYPTSMDKADAIARGEAVYHGIAQCWTCHPAYVSTDKINEYRKQMELPESTAFREDIDKSVARISSLGQLIYVPDFKRDYVKAGNDVRTLYKSISAGITGTAMPTWVDSIEIPSMHGSGNVTDRGDLWALSYYTQHLIAQRPPLLASADIQIREDRAMDTSSEDWRPNVRASMLTTSGVGSGEEGGEDEEEEEEEEE